MSKAVMQLALDALKVAVDTSYSETTNEMFNAAIEALKAELAKPDPEIVAVVVREPDYWSGGHFHEGRRPHIPYKNILRLEIGMQLIALPGDV